MQCIGLQYELTGFKEEYRNAIHHMLTSQTKKDGFLVQAMVIFAIILHAQNQQQAARQLLNSAIDLALDLGMNRNAFASAHGANSHLLEESWRRTWWELYVLDGMLAALHHQTSFKLHDVDNDVPLPCEEPEYSLGTVTSARTSTLDQFKNRVFTNDTSGSSFAYRIEAIRILGTILPLDLSPYTQDSIAIEAAEATLTSWHLSLPPSKRDILDSGGKIDEMLFQAYMIINSATIYLHHPLSPSTSPPQLQPSIPCTTPTLTPTTAPPTSSTTPNPHQHKTLHAASAISRLISLPFPTNRPFTAHTPFFICSIALSTMVHVAACSIPSATSQSEHARGNVVLGLGALGRLGEVWKIAEVILGEVRGVAREVVGVGKGRGGEGGIFEGIDWGGEIGG
ncbi:hypothetical protein ACLMJK_006458 [Lecanora helva]